MTIGDLIFLARRIDRIAGLDAKVDKAIDALQTEVDALKVRVTRLEAREYVVVAEAKAAAGAAAGMVATGYLADIARPVGVLEASSGRAAGTNQLPPS